MRRWMPWMLAIALWPVGPGRAAATAPLALKDRVTDVTVYTDRALVTRTARQELQPGLYALQFSHLPGQLQPDSLKVRLLEGSAALVRGFDVRLQYAAKPTVPQVTVLRQQLDELADQERGLKDARSVEERQLSLAQSLMGQTATSLGKVLADGKAQVKDWPLVFNLLRDQQARSLKALQAIDRQIKAVHEKRRPLEAELAQLSSYQPRPYYQVPVTLEVKRPGPVAIAVDYLVPGAAWTPSYDARLSTDGKRLEWEYDAQVNQRTGEDWSDVHLSLSTAAPAEGGEPPVVGPWFLGRREADHERDATADEAYRKRAMPAPQAALAAGQIPEPRERPMRVVEQGTSVTLEASDAVSIPSDGQLHRALVGRTAFDVRGHYRLVPRLSSNAYLEVEGRFPGPWPLLPGPVKNYVGTDYVGTLPVGATVPGQDLTLAMGIDRAVRVKRRRLATTRGQAGIFGKVRFAEYRYEVALENLKPGARLVTVLEPLPQTDLQEIAIKLLEQSPPSAEARDPGQVRWDLELAAGARKVLTWGYRVEYPLDLPITGLE